MTGVPRADVVVNEPRVRALLEVQHPDLADLPIRLVGEGWDNVLFRLGDELALRMPRRDLAAPLIANEQRFLPELAPRLPLEVPVPVRVGLPEGDYPYPWSVVRWVEGETADEAPPDASEADALGAFFTALHQPGPADGPRNEIRGVPLEVRRAFTEERLDRLEAQTDVVGARIRRIWSDALGAPMNRVDTWVHGDFHPRNILVRDARLRAVIDWGDITVGDRATDLAGIWMLFDQRAARERVIECCGPTSESTLARARGWAVFFGSVLLDTGRVDHPAFAAVGEATLRRLTDDA